MLKEHDGIALLQPDSLSFQAHFHAPPEPSTGPPAERAAPSLDGTCITHEATPEIQCSNGRWCRGTCEAHSNTHWMYIPCKKRDCEVCGPKRRARVAGRVAHGIEHVGGEHGAGWFIGTFTRDIDKADAVKAVARFVAWIRRRPGPRVEYASTWEHTRRRRLHVNLVLAPWTYIPQRVLSAAWQRVGGGRVVWIERVGAGIGQEAAKSRQDTADYFAKWEQMVPTGRAANYSRGWPKLPDDNPTKRRGKIFWDHEWKLDREGVTTPQFMVERQLGWWHEVTEGEWTDTRASPCTCFDSVQLVLPLKGALHVQV